MNIYKTPLYHLLTWFSPSYPIGSFHYSHAIEYAVEVGLIHDAETLKEWISACLKYGTARNDAIIFKSVFELSQKKESLPSPFWDEIIDLSNVLQSSPELWQESMRQGEAALKILLSTYPTTYLLQWQSYLKEKQKKPTLPTAFGLMSAEYNIPLEWALVAYLHSFSANLVTAGIKLIPLGQTEGQKIIIKLMKTIYEVIEEATNSNIQDIGNATPIIDWASVKHETQYTRLFQS